MKSNAGITLIELLVVVAIVGIIAAVALPSYQSQVQQTRRADAATVLVKSAISMESYYASNGYSYLGATAGTTIPSKAPIDGTETYYQITLSNLGTNTYTLSAVPQGGQTSDACGTLTLDQTGAQGAGGSIDDCWR